MWRRNTCGQPPSILQTRFNKFCTWKHVNPSQVPRLTWKSPQGGSGNLTMLIHTLWKNCVCCIPICGRRKNFGPNIENNWSAMLVLRKLSGTQKTQMRELVTERVPIIGFLHPFLVVKIKQSLKVADQDCDIDARGEGGGGDHCWGGKHQLQQNQGGQDDDDAQLIFLFPKTKIPFDWGTITDSCDYVLYRVPMCIVV